MTISLTTRELTMATPDLRERSFDPAHILSVTSQTITGKGQAGLAIATPDGVRICFRSRQAASKAFTALTRVGYQVSHADGSHRRNLLVTGWNAQALDSRLEAMRAVLCQLRDNPAATADSLIERFRNLPPGSRVRRNSSLLTQANAQLRDWVTSRCGIHAPHDPAIIPADVGNALRLRAARALESAIDDLAERHLRIAAHALPLYQSLRLYTTEGQAKDTAIRRASVTYHLPATESTAAPGPRTSQPPGTEPRSPGPPPGDGPVSPAARQAASGFPGWPIPPSPLPHPSRADRGSPAAGPQRQAPVPRRPPRVPNARRQRR
jgi:hypothetical protein